MVDNIYMLKNRVLEHLDKESQDLSRVNVKEFGELADVVKDLAEAEKNCWEASYYRSVTEAMGPSGYSSATQGRPGYSQGMQGGRAGYGSAQMHGRGGDVLDMFEEEYKNLPANERLAMKNRVLATLGIK